MHADVYIATDGHRQSDISSSTTKLPYTTKKYLNARDSNTSTNGRHQSDISTSTSKPTVDSKALRRFQRTQKEKIAQPRLGTPYPPHPASTVLYIFRAFSLDKVLSPANTSRPLSNYRMAHNENKRCTPARQSLTYQLVSAPQH